MENDEAMLNFMSLIPVNATKFPRVNQAGGDAVRAVDDGAGKRATIIRDFGKDKYGAPLFFPNSDAWRKSQGK